jgi:hypothetical protein
VPNGTDASSIEPRPGRTAANLAKVKYRVALSVLRYSSDGNVAGRRRSPHAKVGTCAAWHRCKQHRVTAWQDKGKGRKEQMTSCHDTRRTCRDKGVLAAVGLSSRRILPSNMPVCGRRSHAAGVGTRFWSAATRCRFELAGGGQEPRHVCALHGASLSGSRALHQRHTVIARARPSAHWGPNHVFSSMIGHYAETKCDHWRRSPRRFQQLPVDR